MFDEPTAACGDGAAAVTLGEGTSGIPWCPDPVGGGPGDSAAGGLHGVGLHGVGLHGVGLHGVGLGVVEFTEWIGSVGVGGSAAGQLAAIVPRELSADQRVDVMVAWSKQVAHAQAMLATVVAAMARLDNAPALLAGGAVTDPVAHEVGCALSVSPFAAHQLVDVSRDLATRLPATLERAIAGEVSWAVAAVMVDELPPRPPVGRTDPAAQIEARMLARLPGRTAAQVRRCMKRIVHKVCPEDVAERAKRAERERGVALFPQRDAMASICATLPAADAQYVYTVIDRAARRRVADAKAAAKDKRNSGAIPVEVATLDQMRADLFVQLAARLDHDERTRAAGGADGSPDATGRFVPDRTIAVVIDLATVLGLAEHPGQIPGYGTVPASVARTLAADAAWVRWVSDPSTGQLLDAGGRTYRPSRALRDFIIARDVYCRFPGCSARASGITAEIDHAEPFNHTDPATGGSTDRANLGSLCRAHHRAKTAGLFSITDSQTDGSCRWKSRTGHTYQHDPEAILDLPEPPGQALEFGDESDLSPIGLADSFPFPPDEHLTGDHPPGTWWLIDPPDLDEPSEAAAVSEAAAGTLFTTLEYHLSHALCA